MRSSDSLAASSSSRLLPTGKIDVVGIERDVLEIKERLCEQAEELKILPIVGTGGIGKTTLARNVYHDPLIIENFDICSWVTVSQDYSFGDIFRKLLVSMKDFLREEISGLSNQEMAEKVYQTLIGRRYLIVIDDMWSTKSWDEIQIYFPDNSRGSRIILTTRLEDVAAYADSSKNFHEMQFMDADQSWNLLRREVFKQEYYLEQEYYLDTLEKIGRKIAESCGGLPLAIVVIAGLLSEGSQTLADWEQTADNINLAINADEECAAILSLSYTHLPHHLRHCFLYMGAFPEDYEIRVSELVKLWIAEGFVQSTATKTPEEVAEECLEDLVKRNLVLVTKRKSDGRIKSCGLHDLLRDVCLIKSLEENFLLYFMGKFVLPEIFKDQRRISISYSDNLLDIDGSTIHTIICYQRCKVGSLVKFSLLSILDMVKADLPAHVFKLLHLRHLAFSYPILIPASISNLKNLETLIIYPAESCMVTLPAKIWTMPRLRHLISSSFHPLPHLDGATLPLENLQTLSLATDFVCSERMVEMIPNVKKLGIYYSEVRFDEDYHLENLARLDHLEKLKLEIRGGVSVPFRSSLNPVCPESLKKLTLSGWRCPWEDMSIVGSLPNLQVLKLRNYACDGSIWETMEGKFEHLEFLLIDESNVQEWRTESNHFPMLKSIVLHRCPYLSEIPDDIGYIPTLELIEVDGWNPSLMDSAKRIQKDQIDYGNCSIQVRYSYALSTRQWLVALDLSRNQLSGEIPSTISRLQNLVRLSLSRNKLTGSVFEFLTDLKDLQHLDLSHNNLSGQIPNSLEALSHLNYFDVSFNELSGEIPDRGCFVHFTADFFVGNKGLCGAPRFNVKNCKSLSLRKRLSYLSVLTIPVIGLIFFLVRKICARKPPLSEDLPYGSHFHRRISYQEILCATGNFDQENVIGRGGIGSIYKGIFSYGGVYAVKVFDLDAEDALKSFHTECEILSSVRHRNIVKIITCCSQIDFKALVMAYMPNGDLEKWLHSASCSLGLLRRLTIMIEVVSVIEYLHEYYTPPIVHCDINPKNILLDEDMVSHVGDFGIAKLLRQEDRMLHSATLGTVGYIAPEYGLQGIISTKVDVYSYGVLLMEMLLRRKPTDEMFLGELNMRSWVSQSFPDSVLQIVDSKLLSREDGEGRAAYERCLTSVIGLALQCTEYLPEERPHMRDVQTRIREIRLKYLGKSLSITDSDRTEIEKSKRRWKAKQVHTLAGISESQEVVDFEQIEDTSSESESQ